MKNFVLLLFCSLLFLSCKSIIIRMAGVKQPKIETLVSLKKYLEHKKVLAQDIYSFQSMDKLFEFYNFKAIGNGGAMEVFIFDKNGYLVAFKPDTIGCKAGLSPFLAEIEQKAKFNTVATIQIDTLLSQVRKNDEKKATLFKDLIRTDYYMLIYWAKYLGKSADKVLYIQNDIDAAAKRGIKIHPIYISGDYIDDWGIQKKDIPKYEF
jgi:hypothetical protein